MAVAHFAGIAALQAQIGDLLGTSPWYTIDQARIDAFAASTCDDQWIHTDPARAARESPYGGTVAHGYLTLSLVPFLATEAFAVDGIGTRINYGLNRVRFPAPVLAGASVRGVFRLKALEPNGAGRHLVTVEVTVEIDGNARPACVAEMLAIYAET